MKARVIQEVSGLYIPQIKILWRWTGLRKDLNTIQVASSEILWDKFDNLNDAIALIDKFEKNIDNRKRVKVVAWKNF